MLRMDSKDKAATTWVKAKVSHLGVGDTSELLASGGRERVSIVPNLDILDGIAH